MKFEAWLLDVQYKDWLFHIGKKNGQFFLQIRFLAPDNDLPEGPQYMQFGRKWLLSEHMTKSEVIQTALKAVITAEEHEIREQFLYKKAAIFAPHFDVDQLWEFAQSGNEDIRKPKNQNHAKE